MTATIPITGTLPNGLGLMYLDQLSETLMEIDSNSLALSVYPYENVIRRFFLCGDILFINTAITLTVSIDTVHTADYSVKVIAGASNPQVSDFDSATNSCTTSYALTNSYYTNAIPIDILLTSNLRTESSASLSINVVSTNLSV